jgi:hypothetical protein
VQSGAISGCCSLVTTVQLGGCQHAAEIACLDQDYYE